MYDVEPEAPLTHCEKVEGELQAKVPGVQMVGRRVAEGVAEAEVEVVEVRRVVDVAEVVVRGADVLELTAPTWLVITGVSVMGRMAVSVVTAALVAEDVAPAELELAELDERPEDEVARVVVDLLDVRNEVTTEVCVVVEVGRVRDAVELVVVSEVTELDEEVSRVLDSRVEVVEEV